MLEAPVQYVKHFIKRENCCHNFRVIALAVPAVVANGDSSGNNCRYKWASSFFELRSMKNNMFVFYLDKLHDLVHNSA